MKINNRVRLKREFPQLYMKLQALEMNGSLKNSLVKSKNESPNIMFTNGAYLHSRYNPENESKIFLEGKDLLAIQHVFLIGAGLGYIVDEIISQNNAIKITIYEPDEHILFRYLCVKELPNNVINIFTELNEIENQEELEDAFSVDTLTIVSAGYEKLYKDQIDTVQEKMVELLTFVRSQLAIKAGFQQQWVINSMINFPEIIKTSNIVTEEYQQILGDKPAIIVAAGPSLNEEFDNLRKIKAEKSAYIFAVGSAINALIKNDILPDAAFVYDPGEYTRLVTKILHERNLEDEIPFIFGTTVDFKAVRNFNGKKAHFISQTDVVTKNFLNVNETQIIEDAPSIAVMTLQILKRLNMTPIILVGQNLGYLNDNRYAQGISYDFVENEMSQKEKEEAKAIKDVYGNEMLTNDGFIRMKLGFEYVLKKYKYGRVINTTKYGAHIEGTDFKELQNVIDEHLLEKNIVCEEWLLNGNQYKNSKEVFSHIVEEFGAFIDDLKKIVILANEIKDDYEGGLYTTLSAKIFNFNKKLKPLIESEIHQKVIKHGVVVQNTRFSKLYKQVEYENNPKKKGEKFINIIFNYLGSLCELAPKFYAVAQYVEKELHVEMDNE